LHKSFITASGSQPGELPLGNHGFGRCVISKDFSQFLEPFEPLLCFSSITTLC